MHACMGVGELDSDLTMPLPWGGWGRGLIGRYPAGGPMHVENHIGPIRIKLISGRGRGLVTTRKVKAGELLVSCSLCCGGHLWHL